MKTKPLFIIAASCLALSAQQAVGQSKIEGTVSYNKATPLADVSISIDGSYDGAVSAKDGSFSFETTEVGSKVLVAKADGFEDVVQVIDIQDSASVIKFDIIFTVKTLGLKEVVIRAKKFENEDKNKTLVMHSTDVLTVATDGSVISALKNTPGAQQVGESGDLFVRGGSGAETKMFMDGLLVSNFNYSSPTNQAARSRFPPGLFKGSYFSSGGYSALYGQALSSTLILESEDLPQKSSADFGISPLSIEGGLQILSKDKKGLIGASAKYTDLGLVFGLVKPNVEFTRAPRYLDGSVFYKRKVNPEGIVKFYGSVGKSRVGLAQPDIDFPTATDQVSLRNTNIYSNLTYNQGLKGGWKFYLGTSISHNADRFGLNVQQEKQTVFDSLGHDNTDIVQLRTVLSKRVLYNGKLQWGGEFIRSTEGLGNPESSFRQLQDSYSAGFVELESYVTDRLSGRVGVRLENSTLLERANLAPRAALSYTFANRSLLSASYGTFYQKPEKRFLLVPEQQLGYTRAEHYILTFQKADNYRTFRTELYHKRYDDLVKTVPNLDNSGYGYARGVELFWRDKKTFKILDYWVGYSFLDTKRDYLNYPMAAQPNFAAKHTFNFVARKFFPSVRTNLSASYAFATGRPYYDPNRPLESFMTDQTINYNNLGLSICYLPKIKKSFSVIALTFSNILGNQQVFGYNYSTVDPLRRVPITPTNNPFVFLGLFMNFGVDRTDEIINRGL